MALCWVERAAGDQELRSGRGSRGLKPGKRKEKGEIEMRWRCVDWNNGAVWKGGGSGEGWKWRSCGGLRSGRGERESGDSPSWHRTVPVHHGGVERLRPTPQPPHPGVRRGGAPGPPGTGPFPPRRPGPRPPRSPSPPRRQRAGAASPSRPAGGGQGAAAAPVRGRAEWSGAGRRGAGKARPPPPAPGSPRCLTGPSAASAGSARRQVRGGGAGVGKRSPLPTRAPRAPEEWRRAGGGLRASFHRAKRGRAPSRRRWGGLGGSGSAEGRRGGGGPAAGGAGRSRPVTWAAPALRCPLPAGLSGLKLLCGAVRRAGRRSLRFHIVAVALPGLVAAAGVARG